MKRTPASPALAAFAACVALSAISVAPAAASDLGTCAAITGPTAAGPTTAGTTAVAPTTARGALDITARGRGGSDEPLDPRSTGWAPGKKNPLPWVLAIVGGVLVLGAAGVGIYLWHDARARFPGDTLGVQTFRP